MSKNSIKKWITDLRPSVERIAIESIKGYSVGLVFGVVSPDRKPILKSMHDTGKNFAKMSVAYTTTDILLNKFVGNDQPYNQMISGAVAGAVGSQKGPLAGSFIFGSYFGLSNLFSGTK